MAWYEGKKAGPPPTHDFDLYIDRRRSPDPLHQWWLWTGEVGLHYRRIIDDWYETQIALGELAAAEALVDEAARGRKAALAPGGEAAAAAFNADYPAGSRKRRDQRIAGPTVTVLPPREAT